MITLTELLSFKTTEKFLSQLQSSLFSIPNIQLIDVNREIAQRAATIRRVYGFHLADAIQLATAIHGSANVFISNDQRLKQFKEVPVMLLEEIVT